MIPTRTCYALIRSIGGRQITEKLPISFLCVSILNT